CLCPETGLAPAAAGLDHARHPVAGRQRLPLAPVPFPVVEDPAPIGLAELLGKRLSGSRRVLLVPLEEETKQLLEPALSPRRLKRRQHRRARALLPCPPRPSHAGPHRPAWCARRRT